ncbi:MAG TPA: 3-hydroxyacyl-CoA dehydrogenase NAD-binding domain-containing protein, partial [Candidatus Binataceae bacterium]|nr:3-hydroxyacyl-CoA dehydrogenase NAD-binding domain-containing protein [Candidatus Binataceae bacterium]
MTSVPIRRVAVVGSGVMGRGIAITFAKSGFKVSLVSRDPGGVKELPSAISVVSEPPVDPAPDLVIESIPERLDLKQSLFRRLDELYAGRSILASNTSG